eukprot:438095-Rhodomonas_salina.2
MSAADVAFGAWRCAALTWHVGRHQAEMEQFLYAAFDLNPPPDRMVSSIPEPMLSDQIPAATLS